jgi:hypothetical protein
LSIHVGSDLAKEPSRGPAVVVERHGDRLMVTITRRQTRVFSLSDDEAAALAESLRRELPDSGAA